MANELDKQALEKLLESGNVKKCLQFFHGMPEKSRRECFPVVKAFWSRIRKTQLIENPPGTFTWNPLAGIAQVAYFATATGAEIIKAKRSGYPDDDYAVEIIVDRRPDWVDEWIETLLGESFYWGHWRLIRRLIMAGLAKKPTNPRYFLGMISAVNSRHDKSNIVEQLQAAPDLLKEDIWKLFEYDGDGENSLANTERFEKSWIDALLQLVNKGKLPRAKLLEASMEALERDFNHYRAKWFFEFFDRLEPTDKELKKFSVRLLGLLGVSAPNVASWALSRVEGLAESSSFETGTLCHAIEPILRARAKGTVITALKLLEQQAAACPKEKLLISVTTSLALAHESADVQKATLKLLQSISSPDEEKVRRHVEMLQPTLAASVRVLVTKWLASGSAPAGSAAESKSPSKTSSNKVSTDAGLNPKLPKVSKQLQSLYAIDVLQQNLKHNVFSIPAAIFDGTDLPRLNHVPRLSPIETVEDLIDVCARVIEDGSLVDDAERCIDGMARLANTKPDDIDQMTAPLLKRIRKLIVKGCSPFCGMDPGNDMLGLFYAFCTGKVIEPISKGRQFSIEFEGETLREFTVNTKKPIGFLSAHCQVVARSIAAGRSWQLLSFPTHVGGWIDPRELVKRVNNWTGADPDMHDVILAMLRLAPDNRAAALKSLKDKSSEWIQAIHFALGAEKIAIGKHAALWVAAARARAPWLNDEPVIKKHPGLGPDAGEAARYALQIKKRKSGPYTFYDGEFAIQPAVPKSPDPALVTVLFFSGQSIGKELTFEMGGWAGRTVGAVRWTATIWPQARESFFASSADTCFNNLDWWEAEWQNRTMLEPLIDARTPLRYAGLHFLCGMLAAKEPGESGLATDIAIRAIEDGRLGSDNLGVALAGLLTSGLIKPGRWHKTLSEVARASKVHAAVIQIALQRCFANPKQELPKDSAKLLELLYELSLELNVPVADAACRAWLESGAATGKSAKLAKSLQGLGSLAESQAATRALLEQTLIQRSMAAER